MKIGVLAIAMVFVATGCVSEGAGRDRATQIIHERTDVDGIGSDRDPAEVARLRRDLLSKPLTEDAAVRVALLSSPSVETAFARIGLARADLVKAVRLPNPELEAGFHFFSEQTKIDGAATISITQLIFIAWREQVGSASLDIAAVETAGATLDVALAARLALLDAQAAERTLELQKTVTFAAGQSADFAKRLNDAGNVPDLVALREAAFYQDSQLALDRAELEAREARERLMAALGIRGDDASAMRVSPKQAEPGEARDLADVEKRAIEKSLDLQAVNARYGKASAASDLATAEGFVPDLTGGVGFEREEGSWGVGPHVGLSLPLFNQGQGESAAADATMRVEQSRIFETEIRIRRAARTLAAREAKLRERAAFYSSTMLPLRKKVLDETVRQYNAMSSSAFEVLSAKRDQIEAERGYVETLRDWGRAKAQLDVLLAGRLPEGLGATPIEAEGVPEEHGEGRAGH